MKNSWANKYKKCIQCGTIKIRHHSHGLCRRCHYRKRNQTPERKAYNKRYNKKYYRKRREERLEELLAYYRKKRREYMKDSKSGYYRSYKRWKMIERFRKFLKSGRWKRKEVTNGVKISCNGCKRHCLIVSPFTAKTLKHNLQNLDIFKWTIINDCDKKI